MIEKQVYESIKSARGRDTCYPGYIKEWSNKKPELGQCAITTLLLQELYGGEILFNKEYNHYRNRINGEEVDLTKSQFIQGINLSIDALKESRELLDSVGAVKAKTKERYRIFKERFKGQTV